MMESKIRGVEQELAMNTYPPLPNGSLVFLIGMAMEELKKIGLLTSIRVEEERLDFMALNGFRIYNDMSHLELSSPSYNTPLEAVIYDKVGELFTYYAVQNLGNYFNEVNIYKNNISNTHAVEKSGDSFSAVSYSTHASTILDRRVCNPHVWGQVAEALIPYMVTRVLLIGGGDIVPCLSRGSFQQCGKELQGETLKYVISPRAAFIRAVSSNDTVDYRGLLNERDEPHANEEKYWRLHDINWEGLRSPYQIYLRDCLETLVLMAYEKGFLKNAPKIANPIDSIKTISADAEEFNWKVSLENGREVDAITEILEGFYLAGIERMIDESHSNQVDRMGFNLIKATLQVLGERRLEYFIDGLDWVTKKTLIDEYAPHNLEEAIGICNQYSLIDQSVLGYIGEKVDPSECQTAFSLDKALEFACDSIPLVDWSDLGPFVRRALKHGPEGTREYVRCLVAREFALYVESIGWGEIRFPNAMVLLEEPFKFNKGQCGDQLEKSTDTFDSFMRAIGKIEKRSKRRCIYEI